MIIKSIKVVPSLQTSALLKAGLEFFGKRSPVLEERYKMSLLGESYYFWFIAGCKVIFPKTVRHGALISEAGHNVSFASTMKRAFEFGA